MDENIKKQKEEMIRKLRAVSLFLKGEEWGVVIDYLKQKRIELVRGILANTQTDEKEFTLNDIHKVEIRGLNRILRLPSIIDTRLEGEEIELGKLLDEDKGEIEVGDLDKIFDTINKTVDA